MRIAYLVNYCNTKLSFEESYLPAALAKRGHKVCIITSDRFFPYDDYEDTVGAVIKGRFLKPGREDFHGVDLIRLPVLFESEKRKQIFMRGLKKTLRDFNPDVVHSFGILTAVTLFSIMLQAQMAYSLLVDSHLERHNLKPFGWWKRAAYGAARHGFYNIFRDRVALFLAISEEAKDLLVKLFGIPEHLVRIKNLSADTQRFCFDEAQRQKIRQELGVPPGDILLITAGKITPAKNIDLIINACLPVFERYSGIRLLVLGGGPLQYMRRLQGLGARFVKEGRIIFKGFAPNEALPAYLSAADAGIWLKFSQVILEAMSASLPVIVSGDKSSCYLCEAGNGFVVPANEPKAVSSVLEQVIDKRHHLKEMGDRSRLLAENKYSLQKSAARCQVFYEEAFNKCRRR